MSFSAHRSLMRHANKTVSLILEKSGARKRQLTDAVESFLRSRNRAGAGLPQPHLNVEEAETVTLILR